MGLLWDRQVSQGKPESYASERGGNPKEARPGEKSKVEESVGFVQVIFPRMGPASWQEGEREGVREGERLRGFQGTRPRLGSGETRDRRVFPTNYTN